MIKENYIRLIKIANRSGYLEKEINNFISTYDGTNEREFKALILALIAMFTSRERLLIESETLQKLKEVEKDLENGQKELRKEYKAVQSGTLMQNHAIPSGPSEE